MIVWSNEIINYNGYHKSITSFNKFSTVAQNLHHNFEVLNILYKIKNYVRIFE